MFTKSKHRGSDHFGWRGAMPLLAALAGLALAPAGSPAGPATRDLPDFYMPSISLPVTLSVDPETSTTVWAIEEAPPAGWIVGTVDEGGHWDGTKVRWGPYFDTRSRDFHYEVTPPGSATGIATFGGVYSPDGRQEGIGGDTSLPIGHTHPADMNTDWHLTIAEVTHYASAWIRGDAWPIPPSIIPANYLTKAGLLWRQGEIYWYDANPGLVPPDCWVNAEPTPSPTPSPTPTATPPPTPSATAPPPTASATPTATPTRTATPTPSLTPTASRTPTPTGTASLTPTPYVTPTPTAPPGQSVTITLPGGAVLLFERVPAGSFEMGGNDPWVDASELPVHQVTLTHDYYIMSTEVTQSAWAALMGTYPSGYAGADRDMHPVENISWNEAHTFISALTSYMWQQWPYFRPTFRLPTEAEWEYACRGGTTTRFYFGDSTCDYQGCDPCDLGDHATYCANAGGSTAPVGQSGHQNPRGLWDMAGNVKEWCEDRFGFYTDASVTDPTGTTSGTLQTRIIRGGGHGSPPWALRSSSRLASAANTAWTDVGFRLAFTADQPTPTPTPTPVAAEVRTIHLPLGKTLDLVRIPAGTFNMGSSDPGWSDGDEGPVHQVTITHDLYVGRYEITQEQWTAVMGINPSFHSGPGDEWKPVDSVSWEDSQAFAAALNEYITGTGQGAANLRLPTEAEWEYACRAGSTTRFWFGPGDCAGGFTCDLCDLDGHAWYCANRQPPNAGGTHPVGLTAANAFALYDTSGNVVEWVQDWYDDRYPSTPQVDPTGPITSTGAHPVRGGSCLDYASGCRSASRWGVASASRGSATGLRLAATVIDPPPTPSATPSPTATVTPTVEPTPAPTDTPTSAQRALPGATSSHRTVSPEALRTVGQSSPAGPTVIDILVTPGAGAAAYAVEEVVPDGLTVPTAGQDGVVDTLTHKVKWGPYFDNQPRHLSYQLDGPPGMYSLAGVYSADGGTVQVVGDREVRIGLTPTPVPSAGVSGALLGIDESAPGLDCNHDGVLDAADAICAD